jgi:hypothetical protein
MHANSLVFRVGVRTFFRDLFQGGVNLCLRTDSISSQAIRILLLEALKHLQGTLETDVRDRGLIVDDFGITIRILSEYFHHP